MKLDLRRPCPHCPFRTDVPPYLRRDRAVEIARGIAEGSPLACHETTVDVEDDDGFEGREATSDSKACAGMLIALEKSGSANQMMRIAERLGRYDAAKLDMRAPVVGSLIEFVDHHGQDEEEPETCSVAEYGCLAPAGFMVDGMAVRAETPEEECSECSGCGESVCSNCATLSGKCPYCDDSDGEIVTGGGDDDEEDDSDGGSDARAGGLRR